MRAEARFPVRTVIELPVCLSPTAACAIANHDFGDVVNLREAVKLAFRGLNESQEGGLTLSFRDPSAEGLGKAA